MIPADKVLLAEERDDVAAVPPARQVAEARPAPAIAVPPRARNARVTVEFALRRGDDTHRTVRIAQVLELSDDAGDSADYRRRDTTVGSNEVILDRPRVSLLDGAVHVLAEPQEDDFLDFGITLRRLELVSHVEDVPALVGMRAGSEHVVAPGLSPVDHHEDSEHLTACGRGDVRDLFDHAQLLCELDRGHREIILDPTDRVANEIRDRAARIDPFFTRKDAPLLQIYTELTYELVDNEESIHHHPKG